MKLAAAAILVPALIAAGCASTSEYPAAAGKQVPASFSGQITMQVKMNYLIYLPDGYDSGSEPWPLVLFLHGAGERGRDLELVTKHGPPKLVAAGKAFPFILISPQCPDRVFWSSAVLDALLEDIQDRYRVDASRIYVTGLSMGGGGTWDMAITYPQRFAAIAPICGWGDTLAVRALTKLPIWVFHGRKDPVVPVARSEELVRVLEANGGNVKFTVYPEAGHDSWTETYDNPELYRWMLAQKLSPAR